LTSATASSALFHNFVSPRLTSGITTDLSLLDCEKHRLLARLIPIPDGALDAPLTTTTHCREHPRVANRGAVRRRARATPAILSVRVEMYAGGPQSSDANKTIHDLFSGGSRSAQREANRGSCSVTGSAPSLRHRGASAPAPRFWSRDFLSPAAG
jgi:hypothetical protein